VTELQHSSKQLAWIGTGIEGLHAILVAGDLAETAIFLGVSLKGGMGN